MGNGDADPLRHFEWLIGPRPWSWKRIRRRCRGGCLGCQWALVGTPIATYVAYTNYQRNIGRTTSRGAGWWS